MLRDHKKGGEALFQEIIKGALRLRESLYISKTKNMIRV